MATLSAPHDAAPAQSPIDRIALLDLLDRRLRWLSAWMIHNANHLRDSRDDLKVGSQSRENIAAFRGRGVASSAFDSLAQDYRVAHRALDPMTADRLVRRRFLRLRGVSIIGRSMAPMAQSGWVGSRRWSNSHPGWRLDDGR